VAFTSSNAISILEIVVNANLAFSVDIALCLLIWAVWVIAKMAIFVAARSGFGVRDGALVSTVVGVDGIVGVDMTGPDAIPQPDKTRLIKTMSRTFMKSSLVRWGNQ